jgi:general secretion pathway protein G
MGHHVMDAPADPVKPDKHHSSDQIHVRNQVNVTQIAVKGEKGRQMREIIQERARRDERGDAGFTLIELLVVIVILAILAAIVVFAVGGITDKGQQSACDTDLKTIQTAEEGFYAASGQQGAGPSYTDGPTLVAKGYLTQEPTLHIIAVTNGGRNYTATPSNTNNCSGPVYTGGPQ